MAPIRAGRKYQLVRRYKHKKLNKDLKGFALDLTLRFNTDGHAFLDDLNDVNAGPMPFNTATEVADFISRMIEQNFEEHFGRKP